VIKRYGRQIEKFDRGVRGREAIDLEAAKAPAFVTRWSAVTIKKLPDGDEWLYELKWDGSIDWSDTTDTH